MTRYGEVTELMLKALEDFGPMTLTELCNHIGRDRAQVGSVMSRLQRSSEKRPRRVHIAGWTHDTEGTRTYPRAIYAIGDKPNAQRRNNKEATREKRRRISQRVNSVWMLGMAQRDRIRMLATNKATPEKICA